MKIQRTGRKLAWAAGGGVVLVLIVGALHWEEIHRWYLAVHWNKIAVVVLDDCDPDYRSTGPRGDGVRFLTESGEQRFIRTGFNSCEAIGAHHAIAFDPPRFRIYVRELVADRITALDATGRVLFQVEDVGVYALAVDPKSGNLWCLGGSGVAPHPTIVLDPRGARIAEYEVNGFDIAYSPFDETFWIADDDVTKIDRRGETIAVHPKEAGAWTRVSVAPDPRDGGVWVAERNHPEHKASKNRLLRLDAQGTLVKKLELGKQDPFCVACDPETGMAWVVMYRNTLLRVPVDGDPLPPLAIAGAISVSISSRTGIWVAAETQILKVERDGERTVSHRLNRPSSQSWIAAP